MKYRYQYVDYLPEPEGADTKALAFGNYIHKVLEDGVDATTMDQLLRIAEETKGSYDIHPVYKGKDITCFENFLKFNKSLAKTIATEIRFEVFLTEGVNQTGIIDRVIEGSEGGVLIIDYKTSKREKTKVELFQDPQLQGYVRAWHKEYGTPINKITAAHYYPLTNNFVSVKYSPAQIAGIEKTLISDVWKIRKCKKDELTPQRNQFCSWCSFKPVCTEFNSKQDVDCLVEELQEKKKLLNEEKKLEESKKKKDDQK